MKTKCQRNATRAGFGAIQVKRNHSITALFLTLLTNSSWTFAQGLNGPQAAMEACLSETRSQLQLSSNKPIDSEYGVMKIPKSKRYEIYFNVMLKEPKKSMKVKCVSPGFARIDSFSVKSGAWAFMSPAEISQHHAAEWLAASPAH